MAWNPIDDPTLRRWDARANPPVEREDQIPLKMNKSQLAFVEHDRLGSQEWSGPFYRYMEVAYAQAFAVARGRVQWWQSPYVLERLKHDPKINQQHLLALLAFRIGGLDWQEALSFYQCADHRVKRLERTIKRTYAC